MALDKPQLEKSVEDAGKPDLTLAMEIANYVREELKNMETHLDEQIRVATQANAATVKRIDVLEGSFQILKADLQRRAEERADKDVREAEARYKIALEHKGGLDTQERIEVGKVVSDQLTAAKQARSAYYRGLFDKILPNILTGVVMIVIGPVALGLFIAILVFILRALGVNVQLPI